MKIIQSKGLFAMLGEDEHPPIFINESGKYRKALEEVREIANKRNVGCGKFCEVNRKEHICNAECNAYYLKHIQDIINEVLEDE